eukprot:2162099-Pyramimonas_sp.AAC.1
MLGVTRSAERESDSRWLGIERDAQAPEQAVRSVGRVEGERAPRLLLPVAHLHCPHPGGGLVRVLPRAPKGVHFGGVVVGVELHR